MTGVQTCALPILTTLGASGTSNSYGLVTRVMMIDNYGAVSPVIVFDSQVVGQSYFQSVNTINTAPQYLIGPFAYPGTYQFYLQMRWYFASGGGVSVLSMVDGGRNLTVSLFKR